MPEKDAFEKAVALIERQIADHPGLQEIALTLYPDQSTFDFLRPGESWAEHLQQRDRLVDWCRRRGLTVTDAPIDRFTAGTAAGRAEYAATVGGQAPAPFLRGDPYRLGLSLANPQSREAAIGWAVVKMGPGAEKAGGGEV